MNLDDVISNNVTTFQPVASLKLEGFIESVLRMAYGPRNHDEYRAFEMLGGYGFAASRRKRRRLLWNMSVRIAERVGHGDAEEKMQINYDSLFVPLQCLKDAKTLLGNHE